MVSIRKAKQGFQVRRRGGGSQGFLGAASGGGASSLSQGDKEKLGLLIMAALCIGMMGFFGYVTSSSSNGSALDPSNASYVSGMARFRKPHPNLVIANDEDEDEDPNGLLVRAGGGGGKAPKRSNVPPKTTKSANNNRHNEKYNAVALDIQKSLECDKLMETAAKYVEGRGFGGGSPWDQELPRRILTELQHGDDGGFERRGGGGGGNDGQRKAAKKDSVIPKADDDVEEVDSQEQKWGREAMGNADLMKRIDDAPGKKMYRPEDELMFADDGFGFMPSWTAEHLFCLAAMEDPSPLVVKEFSCEATGRKRRTLLDLWTAARSQIPDEGLFKKILGLAREQKSQLIIQRKYNLWAPSGDKGMSYVINTLNKEQRDILNSLKTSLGPQKLFVDVGSGMGLTTLAVSQMYPMTKIVSIEPASPNWLLQELNLRCNLGKKEFSNIKVILAGVGANDEEEDNMMAKLMWRPTSTTSTRSWTPADEFGDDDVELLVRLRKLKSILAEADFFMSTPNMMDVLNLDCQGCEYNLIPALSEEEFDAIPNVMGGVHWGYIPMSKLPSSDRGMQTHERLCQHENIAKTTKECCSFLDTPVKSNAPGEVLYRDKGKDKPAEAVTVSDIIQEGLCADFEKWAKDHFVHAIKDDFGWFELSSQA
jgi:FkbM family methyltransferase